MKKLLGFALVISSLSALAASDRNVWDLQYLPKGGTVYGQSDATYFSGKIKVKGSSDSTDISGYGLSQTVGYAITDMVLISGDVGYQHTTFESTAAGSSKTQTTGLTDPSLNGRIRLLDEAFRLDLLVGGTYGAGPATTTSSGNSNAKGLNNFNFTGGPRVYLGAELGQKLDSLQYAFLIQAERIGRMDDRTQGDPMARSEAHTNWFMQGSLLNNLVDKLFLRSFASARFLSSYKNNQDSTFAPITDLRVGTGLQYALTDNLLGDLGVAYRQLNWDTAHITQFNMFMFNVGARYQF